MARGWTKRGRRQELLLRVLMLTSEHLEYIRQKAEDELADRLGNIGPLDFTRNPAVRHTRALATAHDIRAGVSGLDEEMALAIGDHTSVALRERYQAAGLTPMPTMMVRASRDAEWFLPLCHYSAVLVKWGRKSRQIHLEVIPPTDLEIERDPEDPASVRLILDRVRPYKGSSRSVKDVYDLMDPAAPSYRVMLGERDITEEVHGETYEGLDQWPAAWTDSDGRPYAPIAIYGQPKDIYRGLEIVEGTLRLAVGMSWWWAGMRDACHQGRNVRGMELVGMDSDLDERVTGISDGAEMVMKWRDTHADKPGEHWQWDAPFDAKGTLESLDGYESKLHSQMGVPVDLTQTGGEPLPHELAAIEKSALRHYDDLRAGDGLVLKLVALRLNAELGTDYPEDGYGIEYSDTIPDLVTPPTMIQEVQDGGD